MCANYTSRESKRQRYLIHRNHSTERTKMNVEGEVVNNRWTVGKKLYYSDKATVYEASDALNPGSQSVIKFAVAYGTDEDGQEHVSGKLFDSFEILRDIKLGDVSLRVPQVYETGVHSTIRYVVMQQLHATLYEHLYWSNNHLPTTTILKVAFQVLGGDF
ncbi:Protein kinase-like protein [Gracilaria domingensis]|nr:Protein kinase-like protein [Gracilaria domingensis]